MARLVSDTEILALEELFDHLKHELKLAGAPRSIQSNIDHAKISVSWLQKNRKKR